MGEGILLLCFLSFRFSLFCEHVFSSGKAIFIFGSRLFFLSAIIAFFILYIYIPFCWCFGFPFFPFFFLYLLYILSIATVFFFFSVS